MKAFLKRAGNWLKPQMKFTTRWFIWNWCVAGYALFLLIDGVTKFYLGRFVDGVYNGVGVWELVAALFWTMIMVESRMAQEYREAVGDLLRANNEYIAALKDQVQAQRNYINALEAHIASVEKEEK